MLTDQAKLEATVSRLAARRINPPQIEWLARVAVEIQTLLDVQEMLAHQRHRGLHPLRLEEPDEVAVVVVPAAHRALVLVQTDDQRGARYQLTNDAGKNAVA